jgi:hypothetical protein
MNDTTHTSDQHSDRSMSFADSIAAPTDVFYVVQSASVSGERTHYLRSDLYETRSQAETELTRLRDTNHSGGYGVWKSSTYVEPAEWLHRVVRSDGTLILPRLYGVEKTDA